MKSCSVETPEPTARRGSEPRRPTRATWTIVVLLVLAVGLAFGRTVRYGFVNLDDGLYVYENPEIARGLSAETLAWAWTTDRGWLWIPLTWTSYLLDHSICGMEPWGYHLANLLLHAATAAMLFLTLRRMTGRLGPSALAAAFFAVHPLRVESVAWVTERKDVLSGLFFVLTLLAYERYARGRFSWGRGAVVFFLFVLGLMAKPAAVTLPFLLLLLDYWPLRRWFAASCPMPSQTGERLAVRVGQGGDAGCLDDDGRTVRERSTCPERACARRSTYRVSRPALLVLEKIPLLFASAAICAVTMAVQEKSLVSFQRATLSWRLGNAVVEYVGYVRDFFWPSSLSMAYVRDFNLSPWTVSASLLALIGVTAAAVWMRRRRPYLLVGWFWYLGMLLPMIGLVQVGIQAKADRFTYLPQIGLCVALAWGAADVCAARAISRRACWTASIALTAILTAVASRQASFWRDSEALWTRALECQPNNHIAQNHLGRVLQERGRIEDAKRCYEWALLREPHYAEARTSLGNVLLEQGRLDEAAEQYQKALADGQDVAVACNNLGNVLQRQGRLDEAKRRFRRAVELKPDLAEAHNNLGNILQREGLLDEARLCYERAIRWKPGYAEAQNHLGNVLRMQGRFDDAKRCCEMALEWKPGYAEAYNNLGNVAFDQGRFDDAKRCYEQALRCDPQLAEAYNNLGLVWVQEGRMDEAKSCFAKAVERKPDYEDARGNLGAALLRQGQTAEAVAEWEKLLKIAPDNIAVRSNVAAAYAEAGRISDAVAAARKALESAVRQNRRDLIPELRARIAAYEAGRAR